ncbi:MAG TPA: GNAT family protein [Pyrinomonadaceae bacterium]|nr:GNAT family protein [Pyrinomonadaceae bacterium]
MNTAPIVLEGEQVRLEPLTKAHESALNQAAAVGELWASEFTIIPSPDAMALYIKTARDAQTQGRELPFVIVRKATSEIVGTTRFYNIERENRTVEIGYTWLALSAQRTAVNTETKLLLLAHAFESWRCIRVSFVTDLLNQQSQNALLRLGAKYEGVLRNHLIMPGGRYRDSASFSIIESEWAEVESRLRAKLDHRSSP